MNDEKELQKQNSLTTSEKIPYYHRTKDSWVKLETTRSYHFLLKKTQVFTVEEKPRTPRTPRTPQTKGGISDTCSEYLYWLSQTYGNNYKHPRTFETLSFVSEANRNTKSEYSTIKKRLSDNKHYVGLPRVKYHREVNRPRAVKLRKTQDGKKEIIENSLILGEAPKYWKGVFDMGFISKKYNIWGSERYNWGDYGLIKQQRLIERCKYLANQLLNKSR